MRRYPGLFCFAVLAVSTGLAQQKTAAPPPKPAVEGPTLEVTMKFIQEKIEAKAVRLLLWSGRSESLSGVAADPANCSLTSTGYDDPEKMIAVFSFREVEKIEVVADSPETSAEFFVLRTLMTRNKSVHIQRLDTSQKRKKDQPLPDVETGEWAVRFKDEDTANRLAKAMVHAVELCGAGGKPEPF
jgi:hypothetical protein